MNIAVLGPVYPLRGGIARHTGKLSRSLLEKGHAVDNISFLKQFPRFLFPGVSQLDPSKSAYPIPSKRLFIPWGVNSWRKSAKAIIAGKNDLLICVWWTPFMAPGFWKICREVKKKGMPILFLLHNVIPHEKMPGMKIISRAAFKHADGFIVQSEKVRQELSEFFPPSKTLWTKLIPHPVYDFQEIACPTREEARRQLNIRENNILLFFGLVRKYKGLNTLLQAMPRVIEHFRGDVRLLIAGEFYDKIENYTSVISDSGIAEHITIDNRFIPDEEVGNYFAAADAVVMPYISASQSGIAQTAFGFGKPVISTITGGLPEIIDDGATGLLCPPENPEALADTICKFYSLHGKIDWKSNISQILDKFSWNTMAEGVEDFLTSMKA